MWKLPFLRSSYRESHATCPGKALQVCLTEGPNELEDPFHFNKDPNRPMYVILMEFLRPM